MRSRPDALQESEVIASLAEGWGLEVESARYAPVGFGSYHWDVTDAAPRRYFVTVDDLDHKSWLGHDRNRSSPACVGHSMQPSPCAKVASSSSSPRFRR